MLRDDYIQRQVAALAAFVAKLLRKPRSAEEAAAEAQASGLVGLDLDLAAQLPASVLLNLLTTADGLDAERCLALGLGIALRLRAAEAAADPGRVLTLRTLALALIHSAIEALPRLDDDDVQAVISGLLGG